MAACMIMQFLYTGLTSENVFRYADVHTSFVWWFPLLSIIIGMVIGIVICFCFLSLLDFGLFHTDDWNAQDGGSSECFWRSCSCYRRLRLTFLSKVGSSCIKFTF